jgi:hypothetical protein
MNTRRLTPVCSRRSDGSCGAGAHHRTGSSRSRSCSSTTQARRSSRTSRRRTRRRAVGRMRPTHLTETSKKGDRRANVCRWYFKRPGVAQWGFRRAPWPAHGQGGRAQLRAVCGARWWRVVPAAADSGVPARPSSMDDVGRGCQRALPTAKMPVASRWDRSDPPTSSKCGRGARDAAAVPVGERVICVSIEQSHNRGCTIARCLRSSLLRAGRGSSAAAPRGPTQWQERRLPPGQLTWPIQLRRLLGSAHCPLWSIITAFRWGAAAFTPMSDRLR